MRSFKSNENIHKKEGGSYYVVSANKASSVTLQSKPDTTSAYWNVSCSEQSSYLNTFNTCFGRYRYLRLPMGLKSSMDIFSRKMDEAFENIPGIVDFLSLLSMTSWFSVKLGRSMTKI